MNLTNYYNKTESDIRYYTKSEINEKVIKYIYEYNAIVYKVLYIKHNFAINFAIESEILLSLNVSTGITINTSAHIENNLTIGGSLIVGSTNILSAITTLQNNQNSASTVDLTNYYTKTASDTRYYTKTQSDAEEGCYVPNNVNNSMTSNLTTT